MLVSIPMTHPTQQRLNHLFTYDHSTGALTRRIDHYQAKAGDPVGTLNKRGYLICSVDGKTYYVHRLIWLMVNGNYPQTIDHKDGDKANNRLENLRPVTRQENSHNNHKALGYYWREKLGKYQALITIDNKQQHIGLYSCPLLARLAYLDAKSSLHPSTCITI